MSDAIPVHCRSCDEPLDVYQPYEDRFCSEECKDAEAGTACGCDSYYEYRCDNCRNRAIRAHEMRFTTEQGQ